MCCVAGAAAQPVGHGRRSCHKAPRCRGYNLCAIDKIDEINRMICIYRRIDFLDRFNMEEGNNDGT